MPYLKNILLYLFIPLTALLSAYLFQLGEELSISYAILPGPIFIFLLIVVFKVHRIPLYLESTIFFFIASLGLYLILFFLTALSGPFCFIIGPVMGGIGSFAIFYFIKKFIKKVEYDRTTVTLIGAACFVLNLILLTESVKTALGSIFPRSDEIDDMFAPAVFFWQTIIGIVINKKLGST